MISELFFRLFGVANLLFTTDINTISDNLVGKPSDDKILQI